MCEFAGDFCNFKVSPEDQFEIKTAKELQDEKRPGPTTSWNSQEGNQFVITSVSNGGDSVGMLYSPFFKVVEHPVECFSFFFEFGQVSVSILTSKIADYRVN